MLAVTFQVAAAAYAIDCVHIVAVIPEVQLRPVAQGAAWLKGVFVYRGELTPVIDLCELIGGYACPPRLSSRIVLVRSAAPAGGARMTGLLAEHMTEARRLPASTAKARPVTVLPYFGDVLLEAGEPLQLLDVEAILAGSSGSGQLLAGPIPPPKVTAGEKDREPTQP
jgi:chemotaxis-related protein WspB